MPNNRIKYYNNRIKYYACMGSESQLLSTLDKMEAQRYKYEIEALQEK